VNGDELQEGAEVDGGDLLNMGCALFLYRLLRCHDHLMVTC
jgi:hypothetical protein